MSLAYVGIGSNLQDPVAQVKEAFAALSRLPRTRLVRCSSLYRSAPVGFADQPDFVNAVASLETSLKPVELLSQLQAIERNQGRKRSFKNAPRSLDLDLLLVDQMTLDLPHLKVPHPRMHERAFVLEPLLEIAPAIAIPGLRPVADCLSEIKDQKVERIT